MTPYKHPNADREAGAPAGWNEKHPDNPITPLPFKLDQFEGRPSITSWWKPSPEEREIIAAGGLLVHSIVAPSISPVLLYAEPQPDIGPDEGLHGRVLAFCAAVKKSREDNGVAYTQGSCYQFHLILKTVWPNAVAWYDGNHVSTEIGGKLYDINGEWTPNKGMDPYVLSAEPGVEGQLKNCYYTLDTARFLKDTTPLPMLNFKAQEEMAEVLKTLNGGDKFDVDNIAAMLVVRLRARGIHLCKDTK